MNTLLKKESELIYRMNEAEIHDGLKNMFQDNLPDREFLDDDEDLREEVNEIQAMIDADTQPVKDQIKTLTRFNNTWFPDGLDQEEQDEFRELLDAAEAIS